MHLANIYRLGLKELKSLWADKVLLILICWAFSGAIYTAATGASQELRNAPVAVVDEDQSPLSRRIVSAFYPPYFRPPQQMTLAELDQGMDSGRYNFTLIIPAKFQHDVQAGRTPEIQLNIDATIMSQAFIGATYIKSIALGEINEYLTVRKDFESHFNKMVPEDMPYYQHDYEGSDDMPAHLKSSLLGCSVNIPVTNGELNLGTWQGIYLCEHRDHGGKRKIVISLWGV